MSWQGVKDWLTSDPKDRPAERGLVRVLVPAAFVASGAAAALIAYNTESAPDIAFGNHLIFAAQLFLVIFYGALLLTLPLARAIFAGELPVELTTKGPRYPERELASSRLASKDLGSRVDEVESALKGSIETTAAGAAKGLRDLEEDLNKTKRELAEVRAGSRKGQSAEGQ